MQEIEEALAAISEGSLAPSKVPAGECVIGIALAKGESAGDRVEAVPSTWLAEGYAVALKHGHIIKGNPIFGRFSRGLFKVTACHRVACLSCGKSVLMPIAVWEAKDNASRAGVKIPDEMLGSEILSRWGHCSCGGKWAVDTAFEAAASKKMADRVNLAVSESTEVEQFQPPRAWSAVHGTEAEAADDAPEWLINGLKKAGMAPVPYSPERGNALVYNRGFWIGYVADPDETGLFFYEKAVKSAPLDLKGLGL